MASLVNCKLVSPVTVEGLSAADLDIASQILYIEPDNNLDVELLSTQYGGTGGYAHYTVAAADFTDYTYLLPADQIEGIAAGSGAGDLGITLEDTGTPYTPDNKVKITVDLADSFSLFDDHTITIDIGGSAKEDNTRDAILALRTDFANQVRGGTITTFSSTTGESTDVTYTGVEGLVDVTFTAAAGITDPKGNSFAITSTPSPILEDGSGSGLKNDGNDFTQEDDIIYVKGDFTIGEWTKIGTITVSLNADAVAAAILANQIPDSSGPRPEGYYGFVFRKEGDAFNSFADETAISTSLEGSNNSGMSSFARKYHRLISPGASVYVDAANTPESSLDTNTGTNSVDAELPYSYWESGHGYITGDQTKNLTKYSSGTHTYLATSWTRDWYFKYPSQQDIEDEGAAFAGNVYGHSFWHTTQDLNNAVYNHHNDLTLSGFLLAVGPQSAVVGEDIFQITKIELVDATWEESNINNAGLPSIEDNGGIGDGQDDYAYIIPKAGSTDGSQTIRIKGTPGASFSLEIEKVEVSDFTTGRSVGEAVVGRNVLEWSEQFLPSGAIDSGTTTILTIPDSGQIDVPWPSTPAFSGDNIFNYYLTVDATSNTQIMQGAFDPRFGADIFHSEQAQSFSGGLNWTLGPGNDAKIRFRQIPNPIVTLSLAPNGGFENSEISRLYSGSNGTDVERYAVNGGDQQIPFKFVIKGTPSSGQKFTIKPEFFDSDNVSITEADSHNDAWAQYGFTQCAPDEEFCSSHGINEFSSLDPSNFLVTHDYPGQVIISSDSIIEGDFIGKYEDSLSEYSQNQSESQATNYANQNWTLASSDEDFGIEYQADGSFSGLEISSARLSAGDHFMTHFVTLEGGVQYNLKVLFDFFTEWHFNGSSTGSFAIRLALLDGLQANLLPTLEFVDGVCTLLDKPSESADGTWISSFEKYFTPTDTVQLGVQMGFVMESTNYQYNSNVSVKSISLSPTAFDYEDHSQQQENEDVSILYLKTVKGNITNGATGYEGDTSQFTVENLSTHDEHFSVVGVLRVNSFGDYTNNYVMDLSKILEWSIPVGG